MEIICIALQLFIVCLVGRILLSWFPIDPSGPMAPIAGALAAITDPVLGPIRSILPQGGFMDFSPLIVIIGVQLLLRALQCNSSIL